MSGVFATEPAILLQLQARGSILLVFLGRIVAALAFIASERNNQAIFFLCHVET